MACQKRIRLTDHSDYGWAMVEAYDNNELVEDPADEKMADVEKEAAQQVTRKRKAEDSYWSGGEGNGHYRGLPLGDQVPVTNPGSSKPLEL